jgi:hypothetical protein
MRAWSLRMRGEEGFAAAPRPLERTPCVLAAARQRVRCLTCVRVRPARGL